MLPSLHRGAGRRRGRRGPATTMGLRRRVQDVIRCGSQSIDGRGDRVHRLCHPPRVGEDVCAAPRPERLRHRVAGAPRRGCAALGRDPRGRIALTRSDQGVDRRLVCVGQPCERRHLALGVLISPRRRLGVHDDRGEKWAQLRVPALPAQGFRIVEPRGHPTEVRLAPGEPPRVSAQDPHHVADPVHSSALGPLSLPGDLDEVHGVDAQHVRDGEAVARAPVVRRRAPRVRSALMDRITCYGRSCRGPVSRSAMQAAVRGPATRDAGRRGQGSA
jgi:hypothetical protein